MLKDFTRIDDDWLDMHPGVEVLGSPTTGLDHIDLAACKRRGVKVVSLQGEREFLDSISSTAEHTWGLILSLARHYKQVLGCADRELGTKLRGKIIGIIGVEGRVGSQVKKYAEAFGMRVLGVDKKGKYEDVLPEADFVTLHIPLVGNEGTFRYGHFLQMKRSAYFINTSRPGIVDRRALLSALEGGLIAGAAVDFFENPAEIKYNYDNSQLVLTNHIGGFTKEDRAATDAFILKKMDEV